jgi:hypothetical protein
MDPGDEQKKTQGEPAAAAESGKFNGGIPAERAERG